MFYIVSAKWDFGGTTGRKNQEDKAKGHYSCVHSVNIRLKLSGRPHREMVF